MSTGNDRASSTITDSRIEAMLPTMTIRDLVAAYPATLEILAPLGIDLCCGGAHQLGEALDLHGIDRAEPIRALADMIETGD